MKEFAKSFYKSNAWEYTRKAYAKSQRNLCERCLARGKYSPGIIVHHKIHLTPDNITDPSVALCWDNLELLCRDCHAAEHKSQKRYKVDDMGRVTAR